MKISEIRSKDTETLVEELRSHEQTLLDVKVRSVTEEGEGHKLPNIRKDIARIQTVLNERRKSS